MDSLEEVETLAMTRGIRVERGVPMGKAYILFDPDERTLATAPGLPADAELLLLLGMLDQIDEASDDL